MMIIYIIHYIQLLHIHRLCLWRFVSTKTLLRRCHQDFALDDSDEEEPLLLTPEAAGEKPAWATGLCEEGLFMNNGEKELVTSFFEIPISSIWYIFIIYDLVYTYIHLPFVIHMRPIQEVHKSNSDESGIWKSSCVTVWCHAPSSSTRTKVDGGTFCLNKIFPNIILIGSMGLEIFATLPSQSFMDW